MVLLMTPSSSSAALVCDERQVLENCVSMDNWHSFEVMAWFEEYGIGAQDVDLVID